ncbi:MAG TPA: DNA polymerase, partial [Candidatus Eremiobacteraceae bacterium]|nr:DNA polymerase [Candidatus Eremiobacteraceae bacterium]
AAAERMAINAPLQGSAADLIKLAMVRVASAIDARGLDARMILQVHDELILDTSADDVEQVRAEVREAMEGAWRLRVPLEVACKSGPTWADIE